MAGTKRKRNNKKQAPVSEELYEAKAILDETETDYLIDWAGNDSKGKPFDPSWEPKSYANQALIDGWKLRSGHNKQTSLLDKWGVRPRRIIQDTPSSPEVEQSRPSKRRRARSRSSGINDSQRSSINPQDSENPLFVEEITEEPTIVGPSPQVHIPELTSSLNAAVFERIEQVLDHSSIAPESYSEPAVSGSARDSVPNDSENQTSQVIPDSQTLRELSVSRAFSPDSSTQPDAVSRKSTPIEQAEESEGEDDTAVQDVASRASSPKDDISAQDLANQASSPSLTTQDEASEVPSPKDDTATQDASSEASSSEDDPTTQDEASEVSGLEDGSETGSHQRQHPESDEPVRAGDSGGELAIVDSSTSPTPVLPTEQEAQPQENTTETTEIEEQQSVRRASTSSHNAAPPNPDPSAGHTTDGADLHEVSEPAQLTVEQHLEKSPSPVDLAVTDVPDSTAAFSAIDFSSPRQQSQPRPSSFIPISKKGTGNGDSTVPASTTVHDIAPSTRPGSDLATVSSSSQFDTQIGYSSLQGSPGLQHTPGAQRESIARSNRYSMSSDRMPSPPPGSRRSPPRTRPPNEREPRMVNHIGKALREYEEKQRLRASQKSALSRPKLTVDVSKAQPLSALPPNVLAEKAATASASTDSDSGEVLRSPSAVPAVESELEPTKDEMNTSERYDTLLPQVSDGHHNDISQIVSSVPMPSDKRSANDKGPWHTIAIPLLGHQRDHYKITVEGHNDLISRFKNEPNPSTELIADVEFFLKRLRDIALHTDLENVDALTQHPDEPSLHAQWSIDASSKFRFLNDLLRRVKLLDVKIAIMTNHPSLADMLGVFLSAKGIRSNADNAGKGGLHVAVISPEDLINPGNSYDVLLSMEPIKDVCLDRPGNLSRSVKRPLSAMLVVPYSIEHIELSVSPRVPQHQRTTQLLTSIQKFLSAPGRNDTNKLRIPKAADLCASCISSLRTQDVVDWPFADLELLDDPPDHDMQTASNTALQKRPLASIEVEASTVGSPKRIRLDSSGEKTSRDTVDPQDLEVTHITDSLGRVTQPGAEVGESEQDLRQLFQDEQVRVDEHVRALEDLQLRFEDQRAELIRVNGELTQAREQAQSALQRLTKVNKSAQDLRTERTKLKSQLNEARQRLLDHTIPERRELEMMRARIAQAEANESKARTEVGNIRKEVEFVRSSYQDASSQAQELAEAKRELEARCTKAEQLATGEQARALGLSREMASKTHERENRRLKQLVQNYERSLKAKDEEIARFKEAGRGRMGTRGNSMPGSPRLGSPIKGRRSRQTSPSAGDLRMRTTTGGHHPLRNG